MSNDKKSSKLGAGCLYLFSLPFCIAGLVTAGMTVRLLELDVPDWQQIGIYSLFATVFGGVGCGLIAFSITGLRKKQREDELKSLHPDTPWKWREDWASGHLKCSSKKSLIISWGFTCVWNLVSMPILISLYDEVSEKKNYLALMVLIFPVIGVGLLIRTIRFTLRWRKFGRSTFQMADVPGVVGGKLAGVIHTSKHLVPEDGFRLHLCCIRKYLCSDHEDATILEKVLWQDKHIMARELIERDTTKSAIPVSFQIPSDVAETDDSNPDDLIYWSLALSAGVPGLSYLSEFEVPVFKVEGSPRNTPNGPDAAEKYRAKKEPAHQPDKSGIHVHDQIDGSKDIVFSAARNPRAATSLSAFSLLVGGALVLQIYLGALFIFPLITGLFELIVVLGSLELWFGVTRVNFNSQRVRVKNGLIGSVKTEGCLSTEILEIKIINGMCEGRTPYYDIKIVPEIGRAVMAGRHIKSKREAEWLVGEMKKVLLKENVSQNKDFVKV